MCAAFCLVDRGEGASEVTEVGTECAVKESNPKRGVNGDGPTRSEEASVGLPGWRHGLLVTPMLSHEV